jgi:hypothetical protein
LAKANVDCPNVDVNTSTLYGNILAFSQTGHVNNFGAPSSARSQIANGDVIGIALNLDAGTYTIYVNNTSTSSGNLGFTGELTPWTNAYGTNVYFILNFGQRPFAYTAPSGFKALCTANLPAPSVTKPSTVFDTKLYTGTGSTQTISGLGFSPDFVWVKDRTTANSHQLADTVRGNDKVLFSDATIAEVSGQSRITGFTSDGFTVGTNIDANKSSDAYVAWTWDAGSSTVTNTSGSITSSVRANATAGFSIVTYTGNSTQGASVGHGLGVAPSMIIVKNRTSSGPSWAVGHTALGGWNKVLYLNLTDAAATQLAPFNGTTPTSTVFQLWDSSSTNSNGANYVAYCFAAVSGYSAMGSYTGNGSADGPFVFTGMRPRWLLIKQSSASGENWLVIDSQRSQYNVMGDLIFANLSNAEASSPVVDFLSNGFKLRVNTGTATNASGSTYIYAAFAESPFNYARAR